MPDTPAAAARPNWRTPALVFACVLLVGGGAALFLLDRTSRDRRDGLAAAKAGKFKEAEPQLKKALEREPDAVDVVEALARGYLKEDDATNADAFLAKWVELRPKDIEPRKMRYEFLTKAKRNEDVYAEGKKLLELDPGNTQLRREVVQLAFAAGDFAAAEDGCRAYLKDFPTDLGLQVFLSNVHRARGNTAAAITILDPILRQQPPPPVGILARALLARAILHEEADEPDKAVPLLREMMRIDKSRQRTAGMRLAVVLARTGQAAESEKVMAEVRRLQDVTTLEEGVANQPANLDLRVRVGKEMIASGYHADGIKMLSSVFDYDATFRPAHRALAEHFEKTGQPARAAQHRRAAGEP